MTQLMKTTLSNQTTPGKISSEFFPDESLNKMKSMNNRSRDSSGFQIKRGWQLPEKLRRGFSWRRMPKPDNHLPRKRYWHSSHSYP